MLYFRPTSIHFLMFRHHGQTRTHEHNVAIATLLSFVAGAVNVVGFVSVHRLTTNVTGHFAFFVDDIYNLKFNDALTFFFYVLAFFFGSFVSNTLVELVNRKSEQHIFIAPVALEIILLAGVALSGHYFAIHQPNSVALVLLFAMGLQNSLVTKISKTVVRTTHLTGLFTDLGIELSQWMFYRTAEQRTDLARSIRLKARIITFFFLGGVIIGLIYAKLHFYSLLIPALLLLAGLIGDNIKFRVLRWAKTQQQHILSTKDKLLEQISNLKDTDK